MKNHVHRKKPKKWEVEKKELENIEQKLEGNEYALDNFKSFPMSQKTIKGLTEAGFLQPTEIQRESIVLALKGHDILGAAKTGSGKTLAFLIPILEKLYQSKWTQLDGLGALIISPTRELAYQTFEVLKKIGKFHDFSAGIVIGGKDVNFEKHKISQTNIIVCTPGRLLQHLEQTTLFVCDNLKLLVLDEADRILDLGFQNTINSIIESLPELRQTLLFSATQTKSIKDLARLSLKNPIYVSANENSQEVTPQQLVQSYIGCELKDKLSLLFSFIKNHANKKIMVFATSCKQVKFIYSAFCRLKPGMSVLALYGTMNQFKRVAAYDEFSKKHSAVLIATDIAARGLDFPEVDWVVQMDCPEDLNTYIHRVGRTARYHKDGKSLLFMMPSEEKSFLKYLHDKKIFVKKIDINPQKVYATEAKLQSACAKDIHLKIRAQKCFISYLRAIFLMKDKKIFDVHGLDTDSFALSLGLAIPPRIRFLQKALKKGGNPSIKGGAETDGDLPKSGGRGQKYGQKNSSDIGNSPLIAPKKVQPFLSDLTTPYVDDNKLDTDGEDDGEELFVIKKIRTNADKSTLENVDTESVPKRNSLCSKKDLLLEGFKNKRTGAVKSKYTEAKRLVKLAQQNNITLNQRIVFDDNVTSLIDVPPGAESLSEKDHGAESFDIESAKSWLREQDVLDKQAFREKVKAKHKDKRIKDRMAKRLKHERKQGTNDNEENGFDQVDYEEILLEDPKLANIIDSLPDPDKIYHNDDTSGLELSNSDIKIKKRKRQKVPQSRHSSSIEQSFDTNLKVNENIAIKLLENL